MIRLDFTVEGVAAAAQAMTPKLLFRLHIRNRTPGLAIEHVMLQAQLRIEAARRGYSAGERDRLAELFGDAADWDRTLRGLWWTNASLTVPGFEEACAVDLPVACSYDFDIAATKYFAGLEEGDAPLLLLFSGSVFFRDPDGDLQIAQIPHDAEAAFRLPARTWQRMMRQCYPDSVWLRVGHELFEALCRYKRGSGAASLDDALHRLLAAAPQGASR